MSRMKQQLVMVGECARCHGYTDIEANGMCIHCNDIKVIPGVVVKEYVCPPFCSQCGGAFTADEMEDSRGICVSCAQVPLLCQDHSVPQDGCCKKSPLTCDEFIAPPKACAKCLDK